MGHASLFFSCLCAQCGFCSFCFDARGGGYFACFSVDDSDVGEAGGFACFSAGYRGEEVVALCGGGAEVCAAGLFAFSGCAGCGVGSVSQGGVTGLRGGR